MSNESMVDRILMNIMEASEIASLMSEMSLAKVLPQAGPIHLTLTEIQFFGRLDSSFQRNLGWRKSQEL